MQRPSLENGIDGNPDPLDGPDRVLHREDAAGILAVGEEQDGLLAGHSGQMRGQLGQRIEKSGAPRGPHAEQGSKGRPPVLGKRHQDLQPIVEGEETKAILGLDLRQEVGHRILDVRQRLQHASGGVHQQRDRQSRGLGLKGLDGLDLTILFDFEVGRRQPRYVSASLVEDGGIDLDHANVYSERSHLGYFVCRGSEVQPKEKGRRQQQSRKNVHGFARGFRQWFHAVEEARSQRAAGYRIKELKISSPSDFKPGAGAISNPSSNSSNS